MSGSSRSPMTDRSRELLAEVLRLPLPERAEFAAEVLASIDGEDDADAEAAWLAEIERRGRRVLSGQSQGRPWEEVRARIEGRLRRP
ncbi:MAG: addiction module protein [Planctomycetes bacterium]|nr:addiction module protein [Planctomycetota bacterium]